MYFKSLTEAKKYLVEAPGDAPEGADGNPVDVPEQSNAGSGSDSDNSSAIQSSGTSGRRSIFDERELNLINATDYNKEQAKQELIASGMSEADATEQTDLEERVFKAGNANARAEMLLREGKSTVFSDFKNYGKGFQAALASSVNNSGVYYDSNPFLTYAEAVKNTDVAKASTAYLNAFNTIDDLLRSNDLKIDKDTTPWLSDLNSYTADNPAYKIKALTLITGKDATKYGEKETVPQLVQTIQKAVKRRDIEMALDNWQTKEGVDTSGKTPSNAGEVADRNKTINQATDKLAKLQKEIANDKDYLTKQITNLYKVGDTVGDVLNKIFKNLK